MRTGTLVAAAILGVAVGGCTPTVDTAAVEEGIRQASARWLEMDRAGDVDGIVALFADDATVHWEDLGRASGPADIRAFMERVYAENPNSDGTFGPDRIRVAASGDLAIEEGSYQNSADQGRYLTVHGTVGGEWKVLADMTVSSAPSGGAPEWATRMLAQWYERYNARDAQGLANLYTANAVVGGARGRAAIVARFRAGWREQPAQCSGDYDGFVIVGPIAAGSGRDACTADDGSILRSRWLAAFEQQADGGWLMIRDHSEPLGQ